MKYVYWYPWAWKLHSAASRWLFGIGAQENWSIIAQVSEYITTPWEQGEDNDFVVLLLNR